MTEKKIYEIRPLNGGDISYIMRMSQGNLDIVTIVEWFDGLVVGGVKKIPLAHGQFSDMMSQVSTLLMRQAIESEWLVPAGKDAPKPKRRDPEPEEPEIDEEMFDALFGNLLNPTDDEDDEEEGKEGDDGGELVA